MKAATGITIFRTAGDQDPVLVHLVKTTDAGDVVAGNAAVTTLRVRDGATLISIAGAAQGGGSGIFAFSPATLPATAGRRMYTVEVTEGGIMVVWARGILDIAGAL
jgi:hypothetical protein